MNFFESIQQRLRFLVSLPERTLRALASLAAGTTTLLTETLLPESLRGSRTYQVTIGLMQRFIVEKIAQVEGEVEAHGGDLPDDFVQRKMVGTVLETAGLFMIGASPLWIFAVLADISGGGRVFLDRLTGQLKRQGVLEPGDDFDRLEDVLDAVHSASARTSTVIDTPPLSAADIRKMAAEIRAHYGDTFRSAVDLVPSLEELWKMMERIAGDDPSLFNRLAGMMTVDALELGRKGGRTVLSVGAAGLQLFDQGILQSYRRTLAAVAADGPVHYLRLHYAPFFTAARRHFDASRKSWTERSLGGGELNEAETV